MNDWTSGYVVDRDTGYTFGSYSELNPVRARFALLHAGLVAPRMENACELGFGQGLSVNMHAAGSPTKWWGTDFNPAHASMAQELARASGAKAHLYDEAFHEFCVRTDLPEFDFIGLHGIWSWVSDENRAILADFVRRKLRVGGVLYISYNTMPGWSSFAPLRDLMAEHAEVMAAPGRGTLARVGAAVEFAEQLLATKPRFLLANPGVAKRFESMKGQNRQYLAHEYFNLDWRPMPFAQMAKWLGQAKLDYACSASQLENYDPLSLTEPQRDFLRDIPDRIFRETTRDFMVNQQFRRDYWVRGARSMTAVAHVEAVRPERFVLRTPVDKVSLKVSGGAGEASLSEPLYRPVLDVLADHRVRSFAEIEAKVASKKVNTRQLLEVIGVLVGAGYVEPAQEEGVTAHAKTQTDRLNAFLQARSQTSTDINYLASPVTGGAVQVPVLEQLLLATRRAAGNDNQKWVELAWGVLGPQGRKLMRQGKPLETPEENLEQLKKITAEFVSKRLPVLQGLKVA